jgi:hypothetical protein
MSNFKRHQASNKDRPKARLAEGEVASVDVCECGTMLLHLGPVTLRLAPCAVSDLLATLGQAVATHAARRYAPREDQPLPPLSQTKRGSV